MIVYLSFWQQACTYDSGSGLYCKYERKSISESSAFWSLKCYIKLMSVVSWIPDMACQLIIRMQLHGAMHMYMYYQVSWPNLISSQNYKCVQLGLSELSWIKIIEINWWCYTFYLQYDWNKWTFISSEHLNGQILLFLQLALAAGLHTTTWGKVTTILSLNLQC